MPGRAVVRCAFSDVPLRILRRPVADDPKRRKAWETRDSEESCGVADFLGKGEGKSVRQITSHSGIPIGTSHHETSDIEEKQFTQTPNQELGLL